VAIFVDVVELLMAYSWMIGTMIPISRALATNSKYFIIKKTFVLPHNQRLQSTLLLAF
jgi:hypothetical protein